VNGLLGMARPAGVADQFDRARDWVGTTERGKVTPLAPSSDRLAWGMTSNHGTVVGRARDGELGLAYVGSFHQPFPDWGEGSPLDDPNRTAAVLLERFRRLGRDFLDGLCGHFAVAVTEPGTDRVLLARAPGGSIRWFFAEHDGALLFSTRLADMAGLLGTSLELDRSLEDFLLGYEFLPHDRTPYRGVHALGPGQMIEWRPGALERRSLPGPNPWGDRFAQVDYHDEDQVVEALHDAFMAAVADQTPSTERVGVLLGGVDSALIAATLHRLGKQVETFSFQYEDSSYNQAFTEELAALLGIRHHWVPITPDVMRDGLQNYAQRFNQVVGQPHYVLATQHVCQVARDHGILHCLTGDGCDGLFLGYPTVHLRAKLIRHLSRVAPILTPPLEWLTRSRWLERRIGHPQRIARNVATILRRPLPARGHIAACTLDRRALDQLRTSAPPQERDTEEVLRELAEGLENVGPIRLAYLGKGKVGLNLAKLEGAASVAGVTVNSPYLHPGLARVAGQIPDELSRPSRRTQSKATGKYAFMQMMERHHLLPDEMIYQPKRSPVAAPVDEWYWGELKPFMLERLERLPFAFDREYAESLVTPKLAERVFQERVGISRYVTPAISLLATYASFTELAHTD